MPLDVRCSLRRLDYDALHGELVVVVVVRVCQVFQPRSLHNMERPLLTWQRASGVFLRDRTMLFILVDNIEGPGLVVGAATVVNGALTFSHVPLLAFGDPNVSGSRNLFLVQESPDVHTLHCPIPMPLRYGLMMMGATTAAIGVCKGTRLPQLVQSPFPPSPVSGGTLGRGAGPQGGSGSSSAGCHGRQDCNKHKLAGPSIELLARGTVG